MRVFNVLLASLLLFFTALCVPSNLRHALLLGWAVGLIPVGIFFIASTNPSSWLISGLGVYWALLLGLVQNQPASPSVKVLRVLLLLVAIAMILLARRDGGLYLMVITLTAFIMSASVRTRLSKLRIGIPLALALIGAVAMFRIWGSTFFASARFPGAQTATDQPNPFVKTLIETPSYFVALFGGQEPRFVIRGSGVSQGVEGYTPTGFTYGLGWTDFSLPSAVGITAFSAFLVAVTVGFNWSSKRKAIAFSTLLAFIPLQALAVRSAYEFRDVALLQPRYMVPVLIPLAGIALLSYGKTPRIFNWFQASVIVSCVSVAGSLAWLATAGRYAIGPDGAFTNFGQSPDWWWSTGPSRLVLFLLVSVLTLSWVFLALQRYGVGRRRAELAQNGYAS